MLKSALIATALLLGASAFAQTTTGVAPNTQQVQLLAPQLVAFSGSTANFDSLVTGLTLGTPVTLTTVGADGVVQIVTFAPGTTMSPVDAARNLEIARQNLIARGVATPTAQQLAVALMGGSLTTVSGTSALTGVITNSSNNAAIQVRDELVFNPAFGPAVGTNLSNANLQALRTSLSQGTFTRNRGPMSALEVNQTLQLAATLLAQQGILNPTPDQMRVALLGGTLSTGTGANVPVQGVLQGAVRNTSDSPLVNTSDSPFFNTSRSPSNLNPLFNPGVTSPNAGGTVGSGVDGVRRGNTAEGAARRGTAARPGG